MEASEIYWAGAAVSWVFSAWCIVATIVEVARGKSKLLSFDVVTGVVLHGTTAVLALWLANMAGKSG